MKVEVEFLGLSRLVTGKRQMSLELEGSATFRDIVRELGNAYPQLIGNVIRSDKQTLQEPNIFNLNAKQIIQASQMGQSLSDGDRVILMSMSAGG